MVNEYQLRVLPQVAASEQAIKEYISREKGCNLQSIYGVRVLRRSIDARQRTVYVNLAVRVFVNEMPPKDEYRHRDYPNVEGHDTVIVVGAGLLNDRVFNKKVLCIFMGAFADEQSVTVVVVVISPVNLPVENTCLVAPFCSRLPVLSVVDLVVFFKRTLLRRDPKSETCISHFLDLCRNCAKTLLGSASVTGEFFTVRVNRTKIGPVFVVSRSSDRNVPTVVKKKNKT